MFLWGNISSSCVMRCEVSSKMKISRDRCWSKEFFFIRTLSLSPVGFSVTSFHHHFFLTESLFLVPFFLVRVSFFEGSKKLSENTSFLRELLIKDSFRHQSLMSKEELAASLLISFLSFLVSSGPPQGLFLSTRKVVSNITHSSLHKFRLTLSNRVSSFCSSDTLSLSYSQQTLLQFPSSRLDLFSHKKISNMEWERRTEIPMRSGLLSWRKIVSCLAVNKLWLVCRREWTRVSGEKQENSVLFGSNSLL